MPQKLFFFNVRFLFLLKRIARNTSLMTINSVKYSFLNEIIEIARTCSAEILTIYDSNNFEVDYKKDDSPVTRADKWADNFIVTALKKITPHIPVMSEEGIETDYTVRKNYTKYWCVDPLDGTKEFVGRTNEFTINIALMENNRPVLGVLAVPYFHKIYFAVKGEGAYLIENNEVKKIQCATFQIKQKHLRIPISRSFKSAESDEFFVALKLDAPIFQPLGSALKFMYIAEGKSDYYPRKGTTMEWDTAAAEIILIESGATIVQLENAQPLEYNKPDLRNPYFVAQGIHLVN